MYILIKNYFTIVTFTYENFVTNCLGDASSSAYINEIKLFRYLFFQKIFCGNPWFYSELTH